MQLVHGKSSVGLVGSFKDIIRQEGCVHNFLSALTAGIEPFHSFLQLRATLSR